MKYQWEYEKRLSVGMIGAGSHTYRNLLPAFNYLPVELKAICGFSDRQKGERLARQYGCSYRQGIDELLEKEELDAVFLCVSPQLHPQLAVRALDAGLHVFIEKPVAVLADDVRRIMEHRKDRVVTAGYKKAFMPGTDKAIELVNDERYGKLQSILAVYPVHAPLSFLEKSEWLANSCHPLSFMAAVGGEIASIETLRSRSGSSICTVEFTDGAIGTLHGAAGPQPIESYTVFGEDWNLKIENGDRVILNRGIPFEYGRTESFLSAGDTGGAVLWEPQNCLATLENKSLFTQGMYFEMKYFCDCILENRQPVRGNLEFALMMAELYEAGIKSRGNRISIARK